MCEKVQAEILIPLIYFIYQANKTRWPDVGLMLADFHEILQELFSCHPPNTAKFSAKNIL